MFCTTVRINLPLGHH
uniref:Uncharacterized protein n=1 Tax=Anguilla anguilla TaxID=7936 RepID=A0A0E9TPM1_ANGAN